MIDTQEMTRMFGTMDPSALNSSFTEEGKNSVPHRLQAARSMLFLDAGAKDKAVEYASQVTEAMVSSFTLEVGFL